MPAQSYLTLHTGRLKPSEKWTCAGDDLFLLFPEAGTGQVSAFSAHLPVTPGDLIALSGRSAAKMAASHGGNAGELVFKWFAVSLDSLFPLFSPAEVSFLQNVTQEYRSPKIFAQASPVATACRQLVSEVADHLDLIHRSQLIKVVAVLLSSELSVWQQKQGGASDGGDDHMLRVFEQLSSQELLTLSVEELADKFGCSRRHLSRLFHQRFGVSVAALRMEMRLLKASSLLRDPGVKIINVAEQCGFNHLGLFNTCFKRRFGATPGVWRNALHEKTQGQVIHPPTATCPLQVSGICPLTGRGEMPAPAAALAQPALKSRETVSADASPSGMKITLLAAAKLNREAKDRPKDGQTAS